MKGIFDGRMWGVTDASPYRKDGTQDAENRNGNSTTPRKIGTGKQRIFFVEAGHTL
jgi:hypothetical protein